MIVLGQPREAARKLPPRGLPLTETPRDLPFHGRPEDEPPPILGSWRRLYIAVLVHLLFWIGVFYTFTVEFDLGR